MKDNDLIAVLESHLQKSAKPEDKPAEAPEEKAAPTEPVADTKPPEPKAGSQSVFISDETLALLQAQIANELANQNLYLLAAAHCQNRGLTGFESWFRKQAEGEASHAAKIYDFVVDAGAELRIPAVPGPEIATDVRDIVKAAMKREMRTTQEWQRIMESARKSSSAVIALCQWFLTEQIEEEDITATLLRRCELADTGTGMLVIDQGLKG